MSAKEDAWRDEVLVAAAKIIKEWNGALNLYVFGPGEAPHILGPLEAPHIIFLARDLAEKLPFPKEDEALTPVPQVADYD